MRDRSSVDASGFFCQAEDGIRDLVRSRGLGDVYKRQRRIAVALGDALGFDDEFAGQTAFGGIERHIALNLSLIHI